MTLNRFRSARSRATRKLCLREGRTELRACYYEDCGPVMTKSEMERAASLYFAKS
jgi:hypothetical protein